MNNSGNEHFYTEYKVSEGTTLDWDLNILLSQSLPTPTVSFRSRFQLWGTGRSRGSGGPYFRVLFTEPDSELL